MSTSEARLPEGRGIPAPERNNAHLFAELHDEPPTPEERGPQPPLASPAANEDDRPADPDPEVEGLLAQLNADDEASEPPSAPPPPPQSPATLPSAPTPAPAGSHPPAAPTAEPPSVPPRPPSPPPATGIMGWPDDPDRPGGTPPSIDDLIRRRPPRSVGRPRGALMTAPEIACHAALGTLKWCCHAADEPDGGFDFGAKDVKAAVSELDETFATPNVVGTYMGREGLIVNGTTIEAGLDLPRVSGHSPFRYAPCVEAAAAALAKLREHGWPDERIAGALGEPDPAALAARLGRLWTHAAYLARYRRGRRRPANLPL